jgi:dihydroflavonol-4-reductase
MKTCYLTGATGCVGRNLAAELLNDGWDVIVLHRKSSDLSRLKECKVRFQEVDLFDPDSVRKSIAPNADAIFHCAGNTSHWAKEEPQQWKDNVLTTRHLVQAALVNKTKRFIFTSTGATNPYQNTDEETAKSISEGYIRTKRLAEIEIAKGMRQGLDAVFVKPGIVVGAYDYNSYSQILKMLKHGPMRIIFPGGAVFCHARSVARGHIQAFEKGRTGESYELGGPFASWLEFAQKACGYMGIPKPQAATPFSVLYPLSYVMVVLSNIFNFKPPLTPSLVGLMKVSVSADPAQTKKAATELGYSSSSLDVMIEDCYRWMVKEKLL